MVNKVRQKTGLTLVEVIVSMALLVIVASILFTGILASTSIHKKTKDIYDAGYILAEQLERSVTRAPDGPDSIIIKGVTVKGTLFVAENQSMNIEFKRFAPDLNVATMNPGSIGGDSHTSFEIGEDDTGIYHISTFPSFGDMKDEYPENISMESGNVFYIGPDSFLPEGYYALVVPNPSEGLTLEEYYNKWEPLNGPIFVKINTNMNPDDLYAPLYWPPAPKGDLRISGGVLGVMVTDGGQHLPLKNYSALL